MSAQEIHIDDSSQRAPPARICQGIKTSLANLLRYSAGLVWRACVRKPFMVGRCILVEIYDVNSYAYETYFKYKDKTKQYLLASIQ